MRKNNSDMISKTKIEGADAYEERQMDRTVSGGGTTNAIKTICKVNYRQI